MSGVLLFVFLAADAPPPAAEAFRRLGGDWEVVGEERDGTAVDPEESLLPPRVRFSDVKPAGIEKRCDIYTIALDPPRITATVAGGEIKGDRMLGVYRLDGDRLTVRLEYGAKTYPAGLKSAAGDGTFVLELRRVKK